MEEQLKTDLPQPQPRAVFIDGLGVVTIKKWPELLEEERDSNDSAQEE